MATFANSASCSRTVATKSSRKCARGYLRVHASASGAFGGHNSAAGSGGNPRANMSGVFQIQGSPVPCTMLDVRDAYEACSLTSSPAERRQCFEVYGLDSDKVDRYYDRVVSMERLIDQGDSVGQNMVASGGAMALYMLAWYILKV